MTPSLPAERGDAGLVHEAMPYRHEDQALAETVGYVRSALGGSQPVLVALSGERIKRVREGLGADGSRGRFADMSENGGNPARIIPGIMHPFVEANPGRRTVIVAEPMWPGRSAAEYAAWVEHEALVNLAFAAKNVSILCLCDLSVLPEQALADVERTHPALREPTVSRVSVGYTDPRLVLDTISVRQPEALADARRVDFASVAQARHVAAEWGRRSGLSSERLTDVLIAISEISGNTLEHAGDGGTLKISSRDDCRHLRSKSPAAAW